MALIFCCIENANSRGFVILESYVVASSQLLSDFASYIRKFEVSGEILYGWQMPQFPFPLRPCSFTTSCLSLGESDIIW